MQLTLGKLSNDSQGDLTAINWSADGSLLAIGSYDSILRVATATGSIYMTSDLHEVCVLSTFCDISTLLLPFSRRVPSFQQSFLKRATCC